MDKKNFKIKRKLNQIPPEKSFEEDKSVFEKLFVSGIDHNAGTLLKS